jgi:predicted nucleic acid-binding protein
VGNKSSSSFVVDTNILFAALLPQSSTLRNILLKEEFTFFAPNFVIVELFKHKEKLCILSKLNEQELLSSLNLIVDRINFVQDVTIALKNKIAAYNLCSSVDENDTPFIALSIELKVPIWSIDQKLISGLSKKGFDNFQRPIIII